MSLNNTTETNGNEIKIVLRDLQSVLRKTMGKDLTVVNYTTSNLLQNGDNFASTIYKVEATIKKTKDSTEEQLSFVAKMLPAWQTQRKRFDATVSFVKEMFVFEQLVPMYRTLEMESGVKNDNLLNILPQYYGTRLTMNENKPNEADDDAVMLMGNLKEKSYYTSNKTAGVDLEHAKVAITELARFHALGMALKYKRPNEFDKAKEVINIFPFTLDNHEFDGVAEYIVESICKDQRIAKYEDRIRQKLLAENVWEKFQKTEVTEPWITVIHGDYWVNNILFHKSNGKIDDLKMIDFQLSKVLSPLMDLPYFLFGSCNTEVLDNNLDELLDLYHETLIQNLTRTGCDVSLLTRKHFDEELNRVGKQELFRCLLSLKFFTVEDADNVNVDDIKTSVMMSKTTELYIERTWRIIKIFAEKGWI